MALGDRNNLSKNIKGCRHTVKLATAVVGDDNTVETVLDG
jgi:hypothetical protein